MTALLDEIKVRFAEFEKAWPAELIRVMGDLKKAEPVFLQSYIQLVSLNTWRTEFLIHNISAGSASFFLEAQNDALVSHVFARMGAWRSALKSLRSCLENVALCIYFKDHPVELQLWTTGKYKTGFSELADYISSHPAFDGFDLQFAGLDSMKREYATLSKAVHGAVSFQMTAVTGSTSLWNSKPSSLGAWRTRERIVLQAINLVLLTIFREQLQGAAVPGLRSIVSLAVSPTRHAEIKSRMGVNLA